MDIKKSINEKLPNSLMAKFINKQKHPVWLCAFWIIIIVLFISLFAVLDGTGRYSHPIYKHTLITSCQKTLSSKQQLFLKRGTGATNQRLNPQIYQLHYASKKNLLTMALGNKGNKTIEQANNGQQVKQMQVTSIQMNLIAQSRQMSDTLKDKKLGVRIMAPNGTLLAFAQNGHLRYSVLPTIPQIK